jgi:catechol 2,3-dioxygenase-like lactoylglutathione lyase family enzyme
VEVHHAASGVRRGRVAALVPRRPGLRDRLDLWRAWRRRAPGVELFLARSDAPAATTVCVLVDDADFAYAVCRERNAPVAEPISSTRWGTREFTVRDPDGHELRIGHSVRR